MVGRILVTCHNPDCRHESDDPSSANEWMTVIYHVDGHAEYWCSLVCLLAVKTGIAV